MVSPITRQLVAGAIAVQVIPLLAVMRYEVIGDPPSSAGGVKLTTVDVSPAITVKAVGAPGAAAGTAEADAVENSEIPFALMAATVKV